MQNKEKILNFLGMVQRAGKLVSGFDAVKLDLNRHKLKVIFIASDLSENTKDKLSFLNRKQNVPVCDLFTAQELSNALGKERKVVAIADAGFGRAMLKKLDKGV